MSVKPPHFPDSFFQSWIQESIQTSQNRFGGLKGSSYAFWINEWIERTDKSVLLITESYQDLYRKAEDLSAILGKNKVSCFPQWDTSPYDLLSPDPEIVAERLQTLAQILTGETKVVITTLKAALQKVMPVEALKENTLTIKPGDIYERGPFIRQLIQMGYSRVDRVEAKGEFSVRGEITDIYSPNHALPARLDFFDEEIEVIKSFSPEDQTSKTNLDEFRIVPAREMIFSPENVKRCLDRLKEKKAKTTPESYREIYDSASHATPFAGMERCQPYYFGELCPLTSYFSESPTVIFWNPENLENYAKEVSTEIQNEIVLSLEQGYITPEFSDFYFNYSQLKNLSQKSDSFDLSEDLSIDNEEFAENFYLTSNENLHLLSDSPESHSFTPVARTLHAIKKLSSEKCKIFIGVHNHASRVKTEELLKNTEVETQSIEIHSASEIFRQASFEPVSVGILDLKQGFQILENGKARFALIGEEDLFGERKNRARSSRLSAKQISRSLSELSVGDYVVHVEYGIAIYDGLKNIDLNGEKHEFAALLFKGEDKVFVPVDSIDLIQKYSSGDGPPPPLNKLSDGKWNKVKAKVREEVQKIAQELVELYAKRRIKKGIAFSPDNEMMREFCYRFPFQETEDQERTIKEVLEDLESDKVSDRLVCGDVGFGKTEVAMRAACKVVLDNYQVGVLCPTTILAQQHYDNFVRRFEDFPVNIEMVSRLRTSSEIKETLARVKEGKTDILIGTHRILSKDVVFNRLGLLVVDEEQRFGVAHKEKLKHAKTNVDTISMSATPIPRTLNMSLAGVRDISVINSPPINRKVIRTRVMKFNEFAIKESVEREIRRGGQVYFLHNSVETIFQIGDYLKSLMPHIKIRIGHAQMNKNDLEKVMLDFVHNRFHLLLCTTIIESGLDIPNANTILINNAQKLGLSQLYQLRGRVGRSNKQAYAYLFTPQNEILAGKSKKRLGILQDLQEIASGFKIASFDMELRGIGNLLGTSQTGHIANVGLEMYLSMIDEEVKKLRDSEENTGSEKTPVKINLPVEHLFPAEFIESSKLRLTSYREINDCENEEELWELRSKFEDRFGKLPKEAENLFETMRLKIVARSIHVEEISATHSYLLCKFSESFQPEIMPLMEMLKKFGGTAEKNNQLRIPLQKFTFEKSLEFLQEVEVVNNKQPVGFE